MPNDGQFTLTYLTGDFSIAFRFFPPAMSTEGHANWEPVDVTTGAKPLMYFNREPLRLTVNDLWLDNMETGDSLAVDIANLLALLEETNEGTPPLLLAAWGDRSLRCVLADVDIEEQFFAPTGEPLRAHVRLTLLEVQDETERVDVNVIDDEDEPPQPFGRPVFGPQP